MAHTTFTLCVEGVQDTSKIENQLRSIADESGLQFDVDVVSPRFKVQVRTDQDPQNPRTEWDNVGVMFCRHGRYELGDDGADDPFVETEGKWIDGRWVTEDEIETIYSCLHYEANSIDPDCSSQAEERQAGAAPWTASSIRAVIEDIERVGWETGSVLRDDIAIILPIHAYEHGGITISHGSFSCQWDSGQLGWHYVTKEALESEWGGDEEKAKKYLEAELEVYDNYLQGDVWGFTIEDEEGDDVDSCWGFYGDSLEDMKYHVEDRFHKALEEAWNCRFGNPTVICDSEGNIVEEDE